jgi:hypothetical protein
MVVETTLAAPEEECQHHHPQHRHRRRPHMAAQLGINILLHTYHGMEQ